MTPISERGDLVIEKEINISLYISNFYSGNFQPPAKQ
jgi:hypothetical protein